MRSLMFCLAIAMFSCTDPNFDKDYTLIDAGLGVTSTLEFADADAATKDVTFAAAAPEGSVWGYRKSHDWISVAQYSNKLSISVTLFEGPDSDGKYPASREGTVMLVKEAADGKIVEAGTITVKQGTNIADSWDNTPVAYEWEWNDTAASKAFTVSDLGNKWGEVEADAFKYVYKIIGGGASSFEQTVNDTVRTPRTIKLKATKENTDKEKDAVAYFIVTDKGGTKIHVRRKLTVKYRTGTFILNPQEFVVSSAEQQVEVEATSLNAASDAILHKLAFKESPPDWIILPPDTLKGDGKFKITIKANNSQTAGRTDTVELVKIDGASFDDPIYLTIKQNQRPAY